MDRHSTVSPFGSLLDEIRQEKVPPPPSTAARVRRVAPRVPAPRPAGAPEPDLRLEAGVVSGGGDARPAPSWRWATSLAVHGAFFLAVVALPLFLSDELPSPVADAKAFFVHTLVAPPPPPLPAPAVRRATAPEPRKDLAAPRPDRVAPLDPRAEIKPEDVIDTAPPAIHKVSADEGVPGGVEEGVPGGIVGGVIEPAEKEPVSRTHVRAGIDVKEPRKLKNVAPAYPEVAARGKIEGVVLLEVSIRPDGRVDDVRILRSIPLLDAAAVDAARQWVFTPTLLGGVPVSVTMTVTVRFSLRDGLAAS